MRNLIAFLVKYGTAILFVGLEAICFFLIINFNQSQQEIWIHSANIFTGNVNKRYNKTINYLDLQNQNDSLLIENAKLLQTIINYRIFDKSNRFQIFEDSLNAAEYKIIPSNICDKTINLQNNFLTLCKGNKDSIQAGMGVISQKGILGIVKNTTDNFAQVLQVLHTQSRISCSILGSDYHGHLSWPGKDPTELFLNAIPKHAEVSIGDTIVTSGFSTSFPYGIPVGTVYDFSIKGGTNTYDIDVKLFNDVSNVRYAYVIDYDFEQEKKKLESDNTNE